MSIQARFSDPHYKNWLKCNLALWRLKESLHGYTESGVRRLFNDLEHNVSTFLGSRYHCNACSWTGIRQQHSTGVWSIRCINCICNVWLGEILSKHDDPKTKTINWGNADITKWSTEPWEIAKIYMTNGQRNKTDLPKEFDCAALLSLIKYCKEFRPVNVQLVSDVIEIRNQICHSPCLEVNDTQKDTWFDRILSLLSDLNIEGIALTEITELKTKDIDEYYREQELKVHQNRVSEVLNDVITLKGSSDSMQYYQAQSAEMIFDNAVSDLVKESNTFGDTLQGLEGIKSQHKKVIFQSKEGVRYLQSTTDWIPESRDKQLITDMRERSSELETYAQVISAMETFIDNNPDLSAGNILKELRDASDAVREMQSRLPTAYSQAGSSK